MKNMKKLSGLIAFVCVLLSVLLLACACTGEQAKEQETTETTGTNPVEKPTETPTETPTTENPDKPNPPDDGKVTYTVTVLGEDGKKLEGVSVQMCDDAGCKLPTATNAEGVVTFRYAPSNYHVTILSAPEGYIVDSQAQYYFTDNALKILLKKAPATLTYKVEVVDHEGFVLEGVTVTLSDAFGNTANAKTNADGIATFALAQANYSIELSDIPEGFGREAFYSFPEGKTETKIALTVLPAYTLTAQDLFGQMVAGVEVQVFRKDTQNLVDTKTTGADGKVTFYLADAEYVVTVSNPTGYSFNETALEFNADNKSLIAFFLKGVSGEKAYQVVVMDAFYQGLADVKVTIYKTADDTFVQEMLTNDLGMADFMLPIDEYYAVLEMPDGYSALENKFVFNTDRVAEAILEGGEAPSFNYSVLVQGSNYMPIPGIPVTLINSMTGETVATVITGADGVAVFENLSDGMYMGTVLEENLPAGYTLDYDAYFFGMMKEASLGLKREAPGAEDAPFEILEEETSIALEAGKTVYYLISSPAGKILTVHNANVVIKIGEEVYTAVDGVLTIPFESYDYDSKLLAVYTADGTAVEFTLVFKGAEGSSDNPIILESLGDYTASIVENGDAIYYRWTATESGILILKTDNLLSNCSFENVNKFWYGTGSYGDAAIYMAVEIGDVINICVDSKFDMINYIKPANEILFHLSLVAGTEEAPVAVDSKLVDVLMPAGGKIYYTINNVEGMKFVLLAGWGENPVVTYNGVQYTVDENGQIKIVFEGSDPVTICIEAAEGLNASSFTVSNANGSGTMEDPFVLGELGTVTASVPENGEIFYTWTATATGTLTLTMDNELNNISVSNQNTGESTEYTAGASTTSIAVNEGDVIRIGVGTILNMDTWTTPAAEIEITFTLA